MVDRQMSEELQIPFDNLLAAFAVEEVVRKIGESEYAVLLWLKNSTRLSLENYRNRVDLCLSYCMRGTARYPYRQSAVIDIFENIFRNFKQEAVQWSLKAIQERDDMFVHVTADILNIKIPVKVKIEELAEEGLTPVVKNIHFITNQRQNVTIRCFPNEYYIVEQFLNIMEKMELMNDLSGYMEIYEILKQEMVSGRKVWELMSSGCRKRNIAMDEQRFEILLSYRTNKFMIKKWKTYLRHEKRKSPTWEEVLDVFNQFFSNLWNSMCRNIIYLGDWMPELGRFID